MGACILALARLAIPFPSSSIRVARFTVALCCLFAVPSLAFGQTDSALVGVRWQFDRAFLRLREPAILRAPWAGAPRVSPATVAARWERDVRRALAAARPDWARAHRLARLYGIRPEPTRAEGPDDTGLLGLPERYVDLAIDGTARLEIRTERLRNERCNPVLLQDPNSGCRGGFRAPRVDNEFNAKATGLLGQRVHVDVDYNTQREFNANNNIRLFYQGLDDEIIRRIEVGTVVFRPPASRFLTAAIPENNFGVNATFEIGALRLQALAATQKGSVVGERVFAVGATTSQPQDRQVRDLDFESGRFYWVVDPRAFTAYPAVDVLNLVAATLPASGRPREVRVYRQRAASGRSGTNPNLGGIEAVAVRGDSPQRVEGRWELLLQGVDYYLDRTGIWFALATKLDLNDHLAVSYTTEAGGQVGTFPARNDPTRADSLLLVAAPNQSPAVPTFFHEMRHVYRVAGRDLERPSLRVTLSQDRREQPLGGTGTYLGLLGLALPTEQNLLDTENRLFPRTRDAGADLTVREAYIVFPHLQPFADAGRLASAERNDSLYVFPYYLLPRGEGPASRFQFRLQYNSTGAGDRNTLSLNALQIKDGSEQLTVGGRRLERGVDYSIDYGLGQVTFLDPDGLFGAGQTQVVARFEERGIFAIAPTTIFGLATTYSLGDRGAINLIGMYQAEQSAFTRPPLGFEPTANLIGGITTELRFKPMAITRLLDGLTTTPTTAESRLDLNAEFAFTRPDANRSREAFLEEFESDAGIPVSLREGVWEFGSRPQRAEGAAFAGGFDSTSAVALTWQNLVPACAGCGPIELRPQDIDPRIITAGQGDIFETVMFLTLHADTAGGIVQTNNASRWSQPRRPFTPRWRSMVTPLSNTGLDLSRNEFLEFWIFQGASRPADSAGVQLVIDLGRVSEDALAIAPESLQVVGADTVFRGRQYVGVGRLDTERSPTGIFNAITDDVGILGDRPDVLFQGTARVDGLALCRQTLGTAVPVFPWGDLSSRCTNGNGSLDTEDLNGDQVLDATGAGEDVFRWVVNPADLARYFVRDGVVTSTAAGDAKWSLYRIPLRTPEFTLGTPNIRLIQHLRLTVATPADAGGDDPVARFALARMRFVGAPWIRRAETPIAGISGALGGATGEVVASIISTENSELGYESPPGVVDASTRRDGSQSTQGLQINEKSLRIIGRGLAVGDRAEAFFRFPAGPQSVLKYREMRVWLRGRGDGWESGDLEGFVKLGSDSRNFYLYHAPARSTTWEPEAVIDLEVWRRLRADVETRWLRGDPPGGAADCGNLGDPQAFVACEGPYLVHLGDPGVNPPNLAAVQEISAGILRVAQSGMIPDAELWVDDIRLGRPLSEVGTAIALDARLTAADVGDLSVAYVRQDGNFQQLGRDPTYRTTGTVQVNTRWALDRFLPASLGISAPASVAYTRSDVRPDLLTGSDVRGDALEGLRTPQAWTLTTALALRRSRRGRDWLTRGLVDPLTLSASLTSGRSRTELSSATSDAVALQANYSLNLNRTGPTLDLGGLVDLLPDFLQESGAAESARRPHLSLVPSNVRWTTALTRNASELTTFQVAVKRPGDDGLPTISSLTHLWRNAAGLTWQPLTMLTLNGDLSSTRDLRVYPDSSPIGRLAGEARESFLGIPVGVERDRTLATSISLNPRVSDWLRPRYSTSSSFVLSRFLSGRNPVRADGDSAGAFILPQTLNNSRTNELGASVDLAAAFRGLFGDSGAVAIATRRLRPVDLSTSLTRTSTFDLAAFSPDLGYMLALGDREAFLAQEGTSAIAVSETRANVLAAGADLPWGFTSTWSYALTKSTRFTQVGNGFLESETRQLEWPVANVRWTRALRSGPITLIGLGTSIRNREGTTLQPSPSGPPVVTSLSSSSIAPDLQLGFRNGLVATVSFADNAQEAQNNGNLTRSTQQDLTGTVSYSFRLPPGLSRLRKPVRSTINVILGRSESCLQLAQDPECTPITDTRRQEIRGGLDTDIMQFISGGLQFSYTINDARHLDRRTSQISLSASFILSLFAGDFR